MLQSNYTDTKLKAWFSFRRLLRHPARKRSGSILHCTRLRRGKVWHEALTTAEVCKPSMSVCHYTHV